MAHVVAGRLNKQIAGDLGTVEKTIKVHRSRMMGKLGMRTVADLVRMAEKDRVIEIGPSAACGGIGPTANSTLAIGSSNSPQWPKPPNGSPLLTTTPRC